MVTLLAFGCTNSTGGTKSDDTKPEETKSKNVTNVSVIEGDGQVIVNWTYPSADFSKVIIKVAKAQDFELNNMVNSKIIECTGEDIESFPTTWTCKNLINGTKYWIRVSSFTKDGNTSGSWTDVSATPKESL